jgi:hypothetical protein
VLTSISFSFYAYLSFLAKVTHFVKCCPIHFTIGSVILIVNKHISFDNSYKSAMVSNIYHHSMVDNRCLWKYIRMLHFASWPYRNARSSVAYECETDAFNFIQTWTNVSTTLVQRSLSCYPYIFIPMNE